MGPLHSRRGYQIAASPASRNEPEYEGSSPPLAADATSSRNDPWFSYQARLPRTATWWPKPTYSEAPNVPYGHPIGELTPTATGSSTTVGPCGLLGRPHGRLAGVGAGAGAL